MSLAYYNEFDPFAASWLMRLIAAGHIAPGVVDTRSIEDVTPNDLRGFTQCHFFAGIGVWSYAARRAGWPDNRPLWSGSAPCQPFSEAGEGGGFADERHLWPAFHWLIDQCRPSDVVGEQVASTDGIAWLDLVSTDFEGSGYAFGSAVLSAAGFGAGHPRHRTYFVANNRRTDANSGNGDRRDCTLQMGWIAQSSEYEEISNARRYEWGVEPRPAAVDHGPTARMELCRGYGNGLDARCATAFLEAVLSC